MGKPERKGPLGIPRNRWDVNIHMGVKLMGFEGKGWFNVVQDRDNLGAVVNAVMNFAVA